MSLETIVSCEKTTEIINYLVRIIVVVLSGARVPLLRRIISEILIDMPGRYQYEISNLILKMKENL